MDKKDEKEMESQENIETSDMISSANVAAARIEAANKKYEELIARQEKLAVQNTFAGKAEAVGSDNKQEESPADYAKRVMSNEIE